MELTIINMHKKLLEAFRKIKSDVSTMKQLVREQNNKISLIQNNEKALLVRIRKLESEVDSVKHKKTETKVIKRTVPKKPRYIGAKTSMKLHDENCPFAKNIKPKNKIIFKSKVKPFNNGYKACTCLKD